MRGTTANIYGGPLLTTKYSGADGSVRWQKRYNGPANDHDGATAVTVDTSGDSSWAIERALEITGPWTNRI